MVKFKIIIFILSYDHAIQINNNNPEAWLNKGKLYNVLKYY